ncbi:MAG TPA: HipA family kinase [Myxococcaceae bacterium]|jgi:hypothetical protein|nr:HipA family kinase [Myxococcaceae bacterium]
MPRTVNATRYVTPLREGGSLPAIVEADDDGLYVTKFRGAGQGPRALVAEWVVGELARSLDLHVPEVVFIEVDPALGRTEPDVEIRDLLRASAGLNLGVDFLPGALTFDALADPAPEASVASRVVALDAALLNVDRTARNPNLLSWHRRLWCIDHGAALYVHHAWAEAASKAESAFPAIRDHVLLAWASELEAMAGLLRTRWTPALLDHVLGQIPEAWLPAEPGLERAERQRAAYRDFLVRRLGAAERFLGEAIRARA